jgi:uncharacterized RDD family membrane protein YckC
MLHLSVCKVLFGAIFFLCDLFSSVPGMSGRPYLPHRPPASNRSHRTATEGNQVLSKSATVPAQPLEPLTPFDPRSSESATPQWKQEVNQRLAAHRNRRGGTQDTAGHAAESPRTASARAAEAAARVAARYAKAPSYSQLLAGEARAVVRAAGAAAEAARNAQAAAQAVLAGLESGPIASGMWEPEEHSDAMELPPVIAAPSTARWQDEPPPVEASPEPVPRQISYAGAQPRWQEALPANSHASTPGRDQWSEMRLHPQAEHNRHHEQIRSSHSPDRLAAEGELFSEEAFDPYDSYHSYDPMGSATVEPVQHLPANLIEFPRELVATRKARPRLAEGPFYDDSHANSQLSIFEVDPDLLGAPVYPSDTAISAVAPPEWASIELGHPSDAQTDQHASGSDSRHSFVETAYVSQEMQGSFVHTSDRAGTFVEDRPREIAQEQFAAAEERKGHTRNSVSAPVAAPAAELLVATLSDRVLATVVDGALVTLAFLAAAVVVVASTSHPPAGRIALIASGCGLVLFWMLYQFLFLSYAEEGTPGMRYARIALCTFDDDNPTREQMRKRIPAMLLSAVPAGLGLAWAIFDGDHLSWHDRLTRTYQRKY